MPPVVTIPADLAEWIADSLRYGPSDEATAHQRQRVIDYLLGQVAEATGKETRP